MKGFKELIFNVVFFICKNVMRLCSKIIDVTVFILGGRWY